MILAIPLLAERFLSEKSYLWMAEYHYTAVLVPVLVMSSVDGLSRLKSHLKRFSPRYLIIAASCLVLILNLRLLPELPLWNLTSATYWRPSANELTGRRALSLIPSGASVITQGVITPHLTHRRIVYVMHPEIQIPDADFIIACDRLPPHPLASSESVRAFLEKQQDREYRKIFDEDGWVVLRAEPVLKEPRIPPL